MQNIGSFFHIEHIIFYSFSLLAILSATAVVLAKNSVRAVLFLVLTFFAMAGLWMTLQAEFLSIILVLVYVGAVMVLFLFVVMMLDIDSSALRGGFTRYLPLGIVVSLTLVIGLIYSFAPNFGLAYKSGLSTHAADYSNIKVLGELLYTQYLYPLEIAGVLLLVAMIAAISLTLRERGDTRTPNPSKQMKVNKKDRLSMVTMTKDTPVFTNSESAQLVMPAPQFVMPAQAGIQDKAHHPHALDSRLRGNDKE